jgi:malate dehydrogenase (oxaloacetate-decarboxylating)
MVYMNNHDFNQEALELHRRGHGKIGTELKVPLQTRDDLSRAYTPGVAEVCREIARDSSLAREYTLKRNTVAIITDGSAILGLGNLGAKAAIPVMEGKAAILKSFAGVDAFPICLDTQDTEEIIKAVKQLAPVFGAVNLEDIAAPRCFEIEERLRRELDIPVMHDDQWGTATVVLAGVINSLKLRSLTKEEAKVVVNGVGSAGVAVSRLLLAYGVTNILFCDSKGIIHKGRTDLTLEKKELLKGSVAQAHEGSLHDAMTGCHIFIGLSKPGTVTEDMVRSMSDRPIILSLANPVPEIMPEEAKKAGAYIVATGRSDYPNQLNNSLIFPGLFKGVLDHNVKQFDITMFTKAAFALAEHVTDLHEENILPSMFDKTLVDVIAKTVV